MLQMSHGHIALWHIDPLLGNSNEGNNETTAVARQRSERNNGSTHGSCVVDVRIDRRSRIVSLSASYQKASVSNVSTETGYIDSAVL
jgi:hypothetical protein